MFQSFKVYENILQNTHILVVGEAGSGKSVLENGLIYTLLLQGKGNNLYCIDLKKVELIQYRGIARAYADNLESAKNLLLGCLKDIEKINEQLQRKRQKSVSPGMEKYIIIDEMADLMTAGDKTIKQAIQRILQIGRSAGYRMVMLTQCPLASVIPTQIQINCDCRIGLHMMKREYSNRAIGIPDCTTLPKYGKCITYDRNGYTLYNVPMITENVIENALGLYRKKRGLFRW